MRFLIPAAALFATACAQEEPAASGLAVGTYTSGDRDALCIAGQAGAQRAGFIVYGAYNANCSVSGRIEPAGAGWAVIPTGDADCKIPLSANGDGVSLSAASSACAYYCGPTATFGGKAFRRAPTVEPVADLAGDTLC